MKVKEVYKRNSVIKRHLALSVCEREREQDRERAECSCIPPAPGTELHPTSCTAALLITVRLYEFVPQTESSKVSFSPRVDGKTKLSVSLENRVHSAPRVLALKSVCGQVCVILLKVCTCLPRPTGNAFVLLPTFSVWRL